jgi:hypothetical protein
MLPCVCWLLFTRVQALAGDVPGTKVFTLVLDLKPPPGGSITLNPTPEAMVKAVAAIIAAADPVTKAFPEGRLTTPLEPLCDRSGITMRFMHGTGHSPAHAGMLQAGGVGGSANSTAEGHACVGMATVSVQQRASCTGFILPTASAGLTGMRSGTDMLLWYYGNVLCRRVKPRQPHCQ